MNQDDLYILTIILILLPLFIVGYFLNREQDQIDAWYLKEYGKERHPKKVKRKDRW
jgi:uncharacterized protein YneF (UPF0154 family)